MLKTRRQMPAFLMLIIIVSLSVLAPYIAPYDPMHAITGQELQPPSARYLLGTDLIGRDVLSRVLYGGQQTLFVALVALIVAVLPGLGLGLLAATYSGPLDQAISAVLNALLTFPSLLLALVVITLATPGGLQVALAVGMAAMPAFARVTRSAARSIYAQPYIEAAYALGARPFSVMSRHVLPNIALPLVAFSTVTLSWSILNAATLRFLGFGGDASIPEWGAMLAEGRITFQTTPWPALAPGIAIMITLFAVNSIAEGLMGE